MNEVTTQPEVNTSNQSGTSADVAKVTELLINESSEPSEQAEAPRNLEGNNEDFTGDELVNSAQAIADEMGISTNGSDDDAIVEPESVQQAYTSPETEVMTLDQINNNAAHINKAVTDLNTMLTNNQITQEQYNIATAKAGMMVHQLKEKDVQRREMAMSNNRIIQQNHDEIGRLVPEWNNPQTRESKQLEIRNFLTDNGIAPEIISSIGDPAVVKLIVKAMQAEKAVKQTKQRNALNKQRNKQRKQVNAAKPITGNGSPRPLNRNEQVDAIASLLSNG